MCEAATARPAAHAGAPGPHNKPADPAAILTVLFVATLAICSASWWFPESKPIEDIKNLSNVWLL